jgi:3-carboxy-cis,cis-muconate cycloisomerase
MAPTCDPEYLQALLDVEVALAFAGAEAGVIPASCVADLQTAAKAANFDVAALSRAAAIDGNIVIPLVKRLTQAVAAINPESARYVHRGATSQDIMDTALVLQLRAAGATLHETLSRAMVAAAKQARGHATTAMPGRTWLQHASPTTFGLKAASWLDMIGRQRDRLSDAIRRANVVQLGGASGTLASLGADGPRVIAAFARQLQCDEPSMPWHTQRDRIADVSAALGIVCGALGKVGRDLTLLAQSEVAEVSDAGAGGSSSMPHKQNPVRAVSAITAAVRAPGLVATMLSAMPQEHERAAGGWQAEWPTLSELIAITQQSADAIAGALEDLRVDAVAMREHLDILGGVAMAEGLSTRLATHVSRTEAMALVEKLVRTALHERRALQEVAAGDAEVMRWLSAADVEHALAPENFLGSAGLFVARVLEQWEM